MFIVFGAHCFSRIYDAAGGAEFVTGFVSGLPIPALGIIWIMMFVYMILGMFIDPAGMCLITVPIFLPIVDTLGFDPLWFGILFMLVTEMAYITPPFGINLFYLQGIVPPEITTSDIYRSIIPYVFCQFIGLALVIHFPVIGLWLPNIM
jgi:TRAP-type mannitol/chloroaromatic compound transport system permease large subunit